MAMDAAKLIREARRSAELSLRSLAMLASTSHSTMSAYESGSKVPSVDTLSRILAAAGFDSEILLRGRIRTSAGLARGDELAAALELAEQFPAAYSVDLEYPVFRFVDR